MIRTYTRYPSKIAETTHEDFQAVFAGAIKYAGDFVNDSLNELAPYVADATDSIMAIQAGKCHGPSIATTTAEFRFAAAKEYTYRTQFELTPSGD